MKISVAGTGYVGLVAGVCFAEKGHDVTCVDIDEGKISILKSGVSPIYESGLEELIKKNLKENRLHFTTDYKSAYKNPDAIFIGVGTPERPDGSANLNYISAVAKQIAQTVENDCLVVVKSTVPVGTNDRTERYIKDFLAHDVKIEVASNPEFLAQGSAVRDTLEAQRIVIGTESEQAEKILREIYEPFNLPIVCVRRRSAEMIKYASNDFLALKISYMNDIANLCETVGADVTQVAEGMSYDKRIGNSFLSAGIGYGGSCFPKDTKALVNLAKKHGIRLQTVEAAIDVNEKQKIRLYDKATNRFMTFRDLKVAVLGVTFKPGTDDLREAPSLNNLNLMLSSGADITVFDPVGSDNLKKVYPEGNNLNGVISYANSAEDALKDADACFIFTEWNEVKALSAEDFKKLMHCPVVFDGRNVFDEKAMEKAGVEYYCIGK